MASAGLGLVSLSQLCLLTLHWFTFFVSPKALLLHFKRFIVTQEARAPSKTDNKEDESKQPVMEMVLKKNKVSWSRAFVLRMQLQVLYSHLFVHFCAFANQRRESTWKNLSLSQYLLLKQSISCVELSIT
jgi:hypothetical protein